MDNTLPDAAQPVWEAYQSMDESKRAHFELLAQLERKYESGGYQTVREKTELAALLERHDHNVKRFKQLIKNLATQDLHAHQALLEHLTLWNTAPRNHYD